MTNPYNHRLQKTESEHRLVFFAGPSASAETPQNLSEATIVELNALKAAIGEEAYNRALELSDSWKELKIPEVEIQASLKEVTKMGKSAASLLLATERLADELGHDGLKVLAEAYQLLQKGDAEAARAHLEANLTDEDKAAFGRAFNTPIFKAFFTASEVLSGNPDPTSKFVEGIGGAMKKLAEVIAPLLVELKKLMEILMPIIRDFQKQFDEIFHPTPDATIASEIKNKQNLPAHKRRTVSELKTLDENQKSLDGNIKKKEDSLKKLQTESLGITATTEAERLTKVAQSDGQIKAIEAELETMKQQREAIPAEREKLLERLAAINEQMGLPPDDRSTLTTNTPPPKVEAGDAEKGKVEKEAKQKKLLEEATEKFGALKTALEKSGAKSSEDEVQTLVLGLKEKLSAMSSETLSSFLTGAQFIKNATNNLISERDISGFTLKFTNAENQDERIFEVVDTSQDT